MAIFDKNQGIILTTEEHKNMHHPKKTEWVKNFYKLMGLPCVEQPKHKKLPF